MDAIRDRGEGACELFNNVTIVSKLEFSFLFTFPPSVSLPLCPPSAFELVAAYSKPSLHVACASYDKHSYRLEA